MGSLNVIASDRRERGNLVGKNEIASSLTLLAMTHGIEIASSLTLLAMTNSTGITA